MLEAIGTVWVLVTVVALALLRLEARRHAQQLASLEAASASLGSRVALALAPHTHPFPVHEHDYTRDYAAAQHSHDHDHAHDHDAQYAPFDHQHAFQAVSLPAHRRGKELLAIGDGHEHLYDTMLGDGLGWRCRLCGKMRPVESA